MSGPKCGSWSVAQNLERERRILAERRTSITRLNEELAKILAELKAANSRYGIHSPGLAAGRHDFTPADNATSEELRLIQEKLLQELNNSRNSLAEIETNIRLQELFRNLSTAPSTVSTSKLHRVIHQTKALSSGAIQEREASISRVVSRLSPFVTAEDRASIEGEIKRLNEKIATKEFDSAMLDLRKMIQDCNVSTIGRERDKSVALELRRRLEGLDGPRVEELKIELHKIALGECGLRNGLEKELEMVVNDATSTLDRAYALRVIFEELEKLGYSSESSIETLRIDGGEIQITNPMLKEYSVQFAMDTDNNQFEVNLVREATTEKVEGRDREIQDRAMEESWCSHFASAVSSAAERGVLARVTKHDKPGFKPVNVIAQSGSSSVRRRVKPLSLQQRTS